MVGERQPIQTPEFTGREIGGVIELVSNPEGWSIDQTEFYLEPNIILGGNPEKLLQTPENLRDGLQKSWHRTKQTREPAGDFDSPKATMSKLEVVGGKLVVHAALTDYFTLWGIPQAASEIHQQFLWEMPKNHETEMPNGISAHSILLTTNGEVIFLVQSRNQAFSAGRLSLSLEEQMDPHTDIVPHNAAYRGYWEELGIYVPAHNIKLLGIAAEKAFVYTTWCFVAMTDKDEESIRESWKNARDYNEASALLVVPIQELDSWITEEIKPDVWKPRDIERKVNPEAVLQPHPTVPWRADLLKKFISAQK